jgi:chorismate synthase
MSGNSFGKLFTVTTFGESHGPAIGCVIDGCPPGMAVGSRHPARARPPQARHLAPRDAAPGARPVEILSGVYEGKTTGTPIALLIRTKTSAARTTAISPSTFRPGHADYTYWHKYGMRDPRGGGRSSARLTAPVVGAGAIAKKWLRSSTARNSWAA